MATSYIYIATPINEWKEGKTEGNKIDGVLHEKVIARLYTTNTQHFFCCTSHNTLLIRFRHNFLLKSSTDYIFMDLNSLT